MFVWLCLFLQELTGSYNTSCLFFFTEKVWRGTIESKKVPRLPASISWRDKHWVDNGKLRLNWLVVAIKDVLLPREWGPVKGRAFLFSLIKLLRQSSSISGILLLHYLIWAESIKTKCSRHIPDTGIREVFSSSSLQTKWMYTFYLI